MYFLHVYSKNICSCLAYRFEFQLNWHKGSSYQDDVLCAKPMALARRSRSQWIHNVFAYPWYGYNESTCSCLAQYFVFHDWILILNGFKWSYVSHAKPLVLTLRSRSQWTQSLCPTLNFVMHDWNLKGIGTNDHHIKMTCCDII